MKFYCEQNKKFYDTPEECEAAEREIEAAMNAQKQEKELDYHELCTYRESMVEAQEKHREASRYFSETRRAYNDKASSYLRKYGELPEGFLPPDALWSFIFH